MDNSQKPWAAPSLYYLATLFMIIQNQDRAEPVYGDYIDNFYQEKHYQEALYSYYYIASDQRRREDARLRGELYIEQFPESERAGRIKRRLAILR